MTDDQLWWASLGAGSLGALLALFGVFVMAVLMLGTSGGFWLVLRHRRLTTKDPFQEIEEWANRREGREP